jgi:hypothetical protein
MSGDTNELIRNLARRAEPVRPLSPSWVRTATWLAVTLPYIGLFVFMMSPRHDLPLKMTDLRFVGEQLAALAIGIVAAVAAFATVIPGYHRKWLVLLLVPLAAWLGSLGQGCIQDWIQSGSQGVSLRADWSCFPGIVVASIVPTIAMAAMLRHGAPLMPNVTMALGGLAAAGLGDFGVRFVHAQDAGVTVLLWHMGAVFALCATAGWAGRFLPHWNAIVAASRRVAAS